MFDRESTPRERGIPCLAPAVRLLIPESTPRERGIPSSSLEEDAASWESTPRERGIQLEGTITPETPGRINPA